MAEKSSSSDQVGGRFAVPIWLARSTRTDNETVGEGTTSIIDTNKVKTKSDVPYKFPWFERKERFKKLSVFKTPQPLISVDDKGSLNVNNDTAKEIEIIDVPLSVVAITGLYRTGKSYLMNRIAECPAGFSLGNSVKSHTKGIWVWCCIHPTGEQQVIMYLDTEGLADIEKVEKNIDIGNKDHDNRIFSLAVLMSSTLIYNSMGVFSADDINKLTFIAKLSDNIKSFADVEKGKEVDKALLGIVSPTFVLCIRDFFLEMDATSDEYFEECLSFSSEIAQCIKTYFPRRKCFTIQQPAMGKTLRNLNSTNDAELSEDFIKDVNEVKKYIEGCGAKHIVSTRPVDGLDFICLMTTYASSLKKGIPMNIEEAVTNASTEHNEKVYQETLRWLRNEIRLIPLPIPRKEQLQTNFFQLQDEIIRMYRNNAYPYDSNRFETDLQRNMNEEWAHLRAENSMCIKKRCKGVLKGLNEQLLKDDDFYNKDGKFGEYEEDICRVEKKFYAIMNKYDKDELFDSLEEYKSSKKGTRAELTRKENERTIIRQQELMEKRLEEKFQEKYRELEREKKDYIEKERNQLLTIVMKQQDMNTTIMKETVEVIRDKSQKKGCVLS